MSQGNCSDQFLRITLYKEANLGTTLLHFEGGLHFSWQRGVSELSDFRPGRKHARFLRDGEHATLRSRCGASCGSLRACLRYGSDFWGSPPHFCSGDLAKRNNNIAVRASYQRLGAFLELSRPFSRKHDELKATGHLIQTIFDGYSSHGKQSSPSEVLAQGESVFIAYEWRFCCNPGIGVRFP